jgi:hypothetical protein
MNVSPRIIAALLALVVVVPVAAYQLETTTTSMALSMGSVAVIVGSLCLLFSPVGTTHA